MFGSEIREIWRNTRKYGSKRGISEESAYMAAKLAEVGLVHRAERRGQLHGLLRVREFTQDDAHIYVEPDVSSVDMAVLEVLSMMEEMYATFGLEYELELSTRPTDRIGTEAVWDMAEDALKRALEHSGKAWKENPGDGAFYGPKIDAHVKDRMGRRWQCGTIQVDFNLPERFKLKLNDGRQPVMLHRVIYGSIERFIGILIEHFKGAFPLWLAPEQARLLPVSDEYNEECVRLKERLEREGLRIGVDGRRETIRKKVKVAWLSKVPYTVVVGQKELSGGDLIVRVYGGGEYRMPLRYFEHYLKRKVLRKDIKY